MDRSNRFSMWHSRHLFFFIFVFSIQLTVGRRSKWILPMLGFIPRTSGVGSSHSTNWATTTAQIIHCESDFLVGLDGVVAVSKFKFVWLDLKHCFGTLVAKLKRELISQNVHHNLTSLLLSRLDYWICLVLWRSYKPGGDTVGYLYTLWPNCMLGLGLLVRGSGT